MVYVYALSFMVIGAREPHTRESGAEISALMLKFVCKYIVGQNAS